MTFKELSNRVKETVHCKCNDFGTPKAFYIKSEEEYKLVIEYQNAAHSSCCHYGNLFKYDYKGKDWYFFGEHSADIGMCAHITEYFQETLTEKKEKFEEFCNQFEVPH